MCEKQSQDSFSPIEFEFREFCFPLFFVVEGEEKIKWTRQTIEKAVNFPKKTFFGEFAKSTKIIIIMLSARYLKKDFLKPFLRYLIFHSI